MSNARAHRSVRASAVVLAVFPLPHVLGAVPLPALAEDGLSDDSEEPVGSLGMSCGHFIRMNSRLPWWTDQSFSDDRMDLGGGVGEPCS